MEDLSTGSMTAAALSTLAIAKQGAGRKLSKKLRKRIDTQIAAGSKWLAEHWRVDGNPGHPSGGPWQYHYLYALERIGSFLGMERIGNHDWYGEGASWLLEHLQEDDRWSDGVGEETATCLALLFLKRASAPVTGVSKGRVHAWGEADSSRPVSLRVTGEYQYTLWIVGFGEQVLRENAWPQDQGKGLRVVKVDYIGYPPHGGPEVLLASVAGNPDRPEASGWHHQHSFRRGGTWRLQARVTVRLPPDSADPEAEPEERVLVSQPLFVPIRANLSAEQLAYASDEARDLLLHHTRFEVQASSQLDDQHQADFVADGSFARVWLCARGDEEPSLSFHFPKGVKAHELVLGHAFTRRRERNWPGPAELEIWLNGDAKVIELRMDPDPRRKTVVPLPKGLVLRRLKILITRQSDGRVGRDPIGFGEIELR